jgi:zinc transporter ZupT
MPVSAWLFIYIAASDMIPELHKESHIDHSIHQIIFLAIWFIVMYWLTLSEGHEHGEWHDHWEGHHIEHSIENE